MKKHFFALTVLLCCALSFVSCGGSDDSDEPAAPETPLSLSTPTVSDVTSTSATVTTTISGSSSGMLTHGFCYGTSHNPDVNSTVADLTSGWTAYLLQLQPGTTYYIRAFLTTSSSTVYSPETSFTTAADDPLANYSAPTYVDDYRNKSGWDMRSSWNLANVHDPTVMKADDGYYYMYQTDASFGNAHEKGGHFHGRRSLNLVDWEYLGGTMSAPPAWILDSLNSVRRRYSLPDITNPQYGYWAPCARKVKTNLYRMYYAVVIDNYIKTGNPASQAFDGSWGERAFIGLMETTDPKSNKWEDKGYVICSSSDKGTNWSRSSTNDWNGYFKFNAIDPAFIITPEGEHWLIYGSWHSGFAAVQLNPETGKPLNELGTPFSSSRDPLLANYGKLVNTRKLNNRWQGSEAPEVVYHDGYYYMFMAYDPLAVPYNTRVVRSQNIEGPYMGINGTNVTQFGGEAYPIVTHPYKFSGSDGWVGISHCAVFDDGAGNWFFASQGRFPENSTSQPDWAPNAVMLGHVRAIRWTQSGWPLVMPERYGAVPQVEITEAEMAGTWELIELSYDFGKQNTSKTIVLGSDKKVTSGTWKDKAWSFDAAKQMLKVGDVELYLQRECDWEATPRRATIVFAGLSTSGTTTYWGKKK